MPPRSHHPARLLLTAASPSFDPAALSRWRDEGFSVTYLPFDPASARAYEARVLDFGDSLEAGEAFCAVAYGAAASACLALALSPVPKLCALVAYYPAEIPAPAAAAYPRGLALCCHLAGTQGFAPGFRSYAYGGAAEGFAEPGGAAYDRVAAELAWGRSLECVRRAFAGRAALVGGAESLEDLAEGQGLRGKLTNPDTPAAALVDAMAPNPFATFAPTLAGGVGRAQLRRFYEDFFLFPGPPPSLTVRLLSRTVGADRVVDELRVRFRHTVEVPWMLPGVPPTDRAVDAVVVSVVCARGGRLHGERVYWDQAGVLAQLGLLDPAAVPPEMRARGMTRLPVVGAEAARKVADEESVESNQLLEGWGGADEWVVCAEAPRLPP